MSWHLEIRICSLIEDKKLAIYSKNALTKCTMMNSLQRVKRETMEVRKEGEGANCSLSAFKLSTFVRHCKPLELPYSSSRMRVGDAISRALCWHSCGTFDTDTNGATIKICILCLIENSFGGKSKSIALSACNGISAISYIYSYIKYFVEGALS